MSDRTIRTGIRDLLASGDLDALGDTQVEALAGMLLRSGRVSWMRRALNTLVLLSYYAENAYDHDGLPHDLMGVVETGRDALRLAGWQAFSHFRDPGQARLNAKLSVVTALDTMLHAENEQEAEEAAVILGQRTLQATSEMRGEGTPELRPVRRTHSAAGSLARVRENLLAALEAVYDNPDDEVAAEASSDLAEIVRHVLTKLRPWE